MNLGNKILELRKQKNVTQDELAAELGVTAAAVSKWENNYTMPDVLMLCALADFFTVTTDELLGRFTQFKHAVISAENPELGKKVADLAKCYGVVTHSIHVNYEEAKVVARENDSVRYLIACYYSGYYGDDSGIINLVSVAPTDNEILSGIQRVFECNLKD